MYVLESCVRVAPRRPLAMVAELPRSGADCHVCPHATQTTMSDTAEPVKEKGPKCRKRDREGEEESEVSEKPRVKREESSEESEHVKGTRSVKLTGNTENRRKTPKEFRAESERLVRAASLARKSPGGTFGAAVFQERDAEAASDSSSYSYSPSVANVPRGRSYASERSYYSPEHPWSEDGRETLSEARAREKRDRRKAKDPSRARSRSRGHAKSTKESRARTARSGMPPEDEIFN